MSRPSGLRGARAGPARKPRDLVVPAISIGCGAPRRRTTGRLVELLRVERTDREAALHPRRRSMRHPAKAVRPAVHRQPFSSMREGPIAKHADAGMVALRPPRRQALQLPSYSVSSHGPRSPNPVPARRELPTGRTPTAGTWDLQRRSRRRGRKVGRFALSINRERSFQISNWRSFGLRAPAELERVHRPEKKAIDEIQGAVGTANGAMAEPPADSPGSRRTVPSKRRSKKREENLAHGDADGNLEELLPNRFDLDPVVPGAGEVDSPKCLLLLMDVAKRSWLACSVIGLRD